MNEVKEILSKCGNYRIVISEDWEKHFSPADDYYFEGIKMFTTSNNHFCPDCAEILQGYPGEVNDLKREFGRTRVFPFSATVHSGVFLSLGVRNDWDSGIIGFLCIDYDKAKRIGVKFSKKYTKEKYLSEYIESWDRYMNEPCYYYEIQEREELFNKDGEAVDEVWNHVDSCGGYETLDFCISEAITVATCSHGLEFED